MNFDETGIRASEGQAVEVHGAGFTEGSFARIRARNGLRSRGLRFIVTRSWTR